MAAKLYARHPITDSESIRASIATLRLRNPQRDEGDALRMYKGSGFSLLNRMLRSGRTEPEVLADATLKGALQAAYMAAANQTIAMSAMLDRIFARQRRLSVPMPLYRGVNKYNQVHKAGDQVTFPEYVSTSLDLAVAWGFNYTMDDGAIFVFHVRNRHIPWVLYDAEFEVLLPRGTRWHVVASYTTSMHPAEAAATMFVGISPEEAVHRTRTKPIRVFELASLPYKAPSPIRPLQAAPSVLVLGPLEGGR